MRKTPTPPRKEALINQLYQQLQNNQLVVITSDNGLGQLPTTKAALAKMPERDVIIDNGNWLTHGYLAGFNTVIEQALSYCQQHQPQLLSEYQQTLKRILPKLDLEQFDAPKDLTNTSSREERTRFYHQEYQNKLLVGLAEFIGKYLSIKKQKISLIIDNASDLSPTMISFIKTFIRLNVSCKNSGHQATRTDDDPIKFILFDYRQKLFFPDQSQIKLEPYAKDDFIVWLKSNMKSGLSYPEAELNKIYNVSRGNIIIGQALLKCYEERIRLADYFGYEQHIDLLLTLKSDDERYNMFKQYIDLATTSDLAVDDLILIRNYNTFTNDKTDQEHLSRHNEKIAAYQSGIAPLIIFHAHAIKNKETRLKALAEPSCILQEIGLYDTWFSYFAQLFADPQSRYNGNATGDDPVNIAFISGAFVLYSLGCGRVSSNYLDHFYRKFPNSKQTPTVIYAQSMTYGRYQVPVNLPLAEKYALRNLQIIDEKFANSDEYHYVKIFAENAYAYIKARQGKFTEALNICLEGERKMTEVYGNNKYKLHQSILIYNTSQVYEIIKDFAKAEKQLRLAIEYDPFYGEYYNDLGNLLARQNGREQEALTAYQKAIDFCPPYHEAHVNRGILLTKLGDIESAIADFNRALVIKPDDARAMFELGNILLRQSRYEEALTKYQESCAIKPDNADLQSNMGLVYSELSNHEQSINHYQQALVIRPEHSFAHNNLAIELFNIGDHDKALEHAKLAVARADDPDYLQTYNYIANNMKTA